jgi:tRNA pseudouridine55 synthase
MPATTLQASADPGQGSGVRAERPPRVKRVRRAVHGVLLLDKPLGWSSNDALQKVKWLLRAEKAGHTGTLDPLATGLLPLCFGAATKFSQISLDADKTYRATLRLGQTTTTGDAEGDVVLDRQDRVAAVTPEALEAARVALLGEIDQVPPMYSALKHEGKALYEYARAGVEIEREARRVTIHRLDILSWQAEVLEVEVVCSKGTYVRTLAQDLGEKLGCGAHLTALRRVGSGPLHVDQAVSLDALIEMSEDQRDALLLPPDTLLADWQPVTLDESEAGRFLSGLRRRVALADADSVRVYGPESRAFLGSAHIKAGELIPTRLLSPIEVQGLLS